jgi:Circadian oscillating protein COP23
MATLRQVLVGLGTVVGLATAGKFTFQAISNQGTHVGDNCVFSYCSKPPSSEPVGSGKAPVASGKAPLDIPHFTAIPESNGDWVVVGEVDDKKRPLIRTNNPNWGKEYPRETRAKMIAGNLNHYFQRSPYPIHLSLGLSEKGYSTLCVSESTSKGCLKDFRKGQIMTFGSKANPNADKASFIAMLNDEGAQTQLGRVVETNARIYIDIKRFIKGEPNPVIVGK